MDVQMHLRNSQIANAYNPQPQAFFTSLYPWEEPTYESSRFVGQLDVAALASSPSVIASDRQPFIIPEEIHKHHHLLLSAVKPSHPGLADGGGDYHYAAAGLSSVPAAPGTSIRMDDSNVGAPFLGSFSGSKILGNPQIDMGRVGYSWRGIPQVDPAAALATSRFEPSGIFLDTRLGSMFSFDNHIAGMGISSASQEHTNSLLRALGTDQRFNNTSPLFRFPEIQQTAIDLRSQMHNPLDSSSEVRYRSSASVGGLAVTQLPQETHTLAQSTANVKRRKFQYEWEKDDSWSRDEYDADDQDTASTEAGNLQVGSACNLCVQPMDQTRHSRDSLNLGKHCPSGGYYSSGEKSSEVWASALFPERPNLSEACANAIIPKSFNVSDVLNAKLHTRKGTTEHLEKSDRNTVKSKPKLRNAGVPEKSDTVASSSEEMMMWPPAVVIYNTRTEKTAEGLWDGMGGKEMDTYLNGLGHLQGKSKPLWGKEGHKGLVVVKYKPNLSGLREAERLHKHFEENGRGRQQWLHINSVQNASSNDSLEDGVDFVYVDPETNESKRVLYGFLAGPSDIKNFDHASKIKFSVQSKSDVLTRQHLLERVS